MRSVACGRWLSGARKSPGMMMPGPLVPAGNWIGQHGEAVRYEAFPAFWPVQWPGRTAERNHSRQGSAVADCGFFGVAGAPVGSPAGVADCRLYGAGRLALAGAEGAGAFARALVEIGR